MKIVRIAIHIRKGALGGIYASRKEFPDIALNSQVTLTPKSHPARHIDDTAKILLKKLNIPYSICGYTGKWNGKQYDSIIVRVNEKDNDKLRTQFDIVSTLKLN